MQKLLTVTINVWLSEPELPPLGRDVNARRFQLNGQKPAALHIHRDANQTWTGGIVCSNNVRIPPLQDIHIVDASDSQQNLPNYYITTTHIIYYSLTVFLHVLLSLLTLNEDSQPEQE